MNTRRKDHQPRYWVRDNSWHQVFECSNYNNALLKSEMVDHVHDGVHVTEIIKSIKRPSVIN